MTVDIQPGWIDFPELSSNPSAPSTTSARIFAKNDQELYRINDLSNVGQLTNYGQLIEVVPYTEIDYGTQLLSIQNLPNIPGTTRMIITLSLSNRVNAFNLVTMRVNNYIVAFYHSVWAYIYTSSRAAAGHFQAQDNAMLTANFGPGSGTYPGATSNSEAPVAAYIIIGGYNQDRFYPHIHWFMSTDFGPTQPLINWGTGMYRRNEVVKSVDFYLEASVGGAAGHFRNRFTRYRVQVQ